MCQIRRGLLKMPFYSNVCARKLLDTWEVSDVAEREV